MPRALFVVFSMLLLVASVGAAALGTLSRLRVQSEEVFDRYLEDVGRLDALLDSRREAAHHIRTFLLTGDQSHVEALHQTRTRMDRLLVSLDQHVTDPEGRALLIEVHAAELALRKIADREIARRVPSVDVQELERSYSEHFLPGRQALDEAVEALRARMDKQLGHERTTLMGEHDDAVETVTLTIVFALILVVALGLATLRAVRRRERAEALQTALLDSERIARADAERQRGLLRTLVAEAPVGIAILSGGGAVLELNDEGQRQLGRTADEVLGLPSQALGLDVEGLWSPGAQVEWRTFDVERTGRTLRAGVVSVALDGGPGCILITHDLTDELKARAATEALRERLVAGVAHDLRGPLTVARLSAQVLQGAGGENPELRRNLTRRILLGLDRAERIVRNILDAGRAQAGQRLQLSPRRVELASIVGRTIEELHEQSERDIVFEGPQQPVEGEWDPDALERISWNLMTNAVKYGDPEVTVRVRLVPLADRVRLEVENGGPEIPAARLERLFDAWLRPPDEPRAKGWGLGLYLVRALAEAHRGAVFAESSAERTRFTVELPWSGAAQAADSRAADPRTGAGGSDPGGVEAQGAEAGAPEVGPPAIA